ncbi:MAG: NFYB/HAP3 family transcription factor subunit [Candidatus Aenigmatarchaeota archaeon]|nr:NFYB/HAP3 family transcription factor subunit [Candidatus Aenigmarchaeota archaeon]
MVKDFPLLPLEKIAREAGAERVSRSALIALKEVLLEEAENLARDAVKLAEHAKRVTVKREDVILAAKR